MQYFIGLLVGIFVTATFNLISREIHHYGTFEIDESKEDKVLFRLNWKKDPYGASKHSYITFDIYKTSLKSLDEDSIPPVAKK